EKGDEQIEGLLRARREYTQGRVRAHAVKIFQDGVIEAKTAAMLEPYVGTENDKGIALIEPETLKRIATRLDREGFQLHFHAIGDAAIRQVFDALEAARRSNGARDSRHHLVHIQLFHPDDIPRFRELGAVANFQPLWALSDGYIKELTLPILPPETHRFIYPIRSVLRSGGIVAFGSDWSVSSANPLEEMEVAVRRADPRKPDDPPFLPDERIDLRDAIAAFTINAAYVGFQDDRTGSIEPGKLADLVVLDRNLFAIDPSEISDAKVLLTLLGGKPVYGNWRDLGD
ncbi:MAG TPA: amidohydrolase family protein, partial [Myxococcota bacterium]